MKGNEKTNSNKLTYGGKIPPQAVDVEEAVLGALMLEKDAIDKAYDILTPESFYKESHQIIYQAIKDLFDTAQPIDLITIVNQLRKKALLEKIGGPGYLAELTNRVGSAANIEYYCRIISQKHILREMITLSSDIQTKSYEEGTDFYELLDWVEKSIFKITDSNLKSSYDTMANLIDKSLKIMDEQRGKSDEISGVSSGYTDLDRITSGWQPSDLIILAARPGMGKTAFVLNIARNAAVLAHKPVAFFSLEMSNLQLVLRLIASEAEIEGQKIKSGKIAEHEVIQLHSKIQTITNAPIYLDDSPSLNVYDLRAKCRRLKAQHNIELIIIDYLQLMSGSGTNDKKTFNREQEISYISRSLKQLAKELNVPVIALSQLSRQVETRGTSKKPQLSDLRESGSIEQDADQVLFIYRPEYYGINEFEDQSSTAGIAELIIAKNRHGDTHTVKLQFIKHFGKFLNEHDTGNVIPAYNQFNKYKDDDYAPSVVTLKSKINDENENDLSAFKNNISKVGNTTDDEIPF